MAHESAKALLSRVRENPEPAVVTKLVHFTDEHGIDAVAELWAVAEARTLPGSLWRIYLLRNTILTNPEMVALAFQRGLAQADSIDPLMAGAAEPAGPAEITQLADTILGGLFSADFSISLERAAAFSRLLSMGLTDLAFDAESANSTATRVNEHTNQALSFKLLADDLSTSAQLWRINELS